MVKVKGKVELCSSENWATFFKSPQGLENKKLFDRYYAIENVVNGNINEKYRHFLAQPIVEGDSITWFSKPFKDTPRQLSTLLGKDHTYYEQIKNDTLIHFSTVIQALKQEGKRNEAESLENAIKFVNDDFVYCFDDKTVLGIWGMQLKDNIREPIGSIVKNLFVIGPKPYPPQPVPPELPPGSNQEPDPEPQQEEPPLSPFAVRFNEGDGGSLFGSPVLFKQNNESIAGSEVPQIKAKEGYEFTGWDKNPNDYTVTEDTEFTAQYNKIPPPVLPTGLPWYTRFWNWLRGLFFGRGCLKWLLWLLLFLLLLMLFWWLFRSCDNGDHSSAIPNPIENKPWVGDDPRSGDGGIYNPGNPYEPVPTPPPYHDVLPPNQGVMPPIDTTKIIRDPGNPVIIGNRLNIVMENEEKSILDFAKDFKAKYPDDKYKVVYYDDVVKRMQIEVPVEERAKLKQEIPPKFAPGYELFVFDEALFESEYLPDDPAFNDTDKLWYLETIHAPQAWDVTRGASKLTIAIIDNGFSLKHPELQSKVVMPYNVWLHSKEIFPQPIDHGTHVAGTALALMNNGIGICGIAPECAFMPVQVADKNGLMTTTSILDGVLYALYQGADIINISLGTKFTGTLPGDKQRDLQDNHFKEEERLWKEVMKIASKHKSVIVMAAGNDNMLAGVDPMKRPKNFIIVSAVDKNNREFRKANFSNYGDYSTISAPGVDIYSTVGNDAYRSMDGTSMAAPIVSGAIALMKSLNDSLTNEQIICILQGTGLEANGKIGKLIQLDKALEKVQKGELDDCDTSPEIPSSGDVQILLNWNNYNDLDLACVDPDGNTIWFRNKKVQSGGQLEIDKNAKYPDSKTPIENIFWQQGSAPNGTYQVYLVYYKRHEPAINETAYKITTKYGEKTEEFNGQIKKDDGRIHICTFIFGDASNPQNPNNPNTPPTDKRRDELKRDRERLQRQLDEIDRQLHDLDKLN